MNAFSLFPQTVGANQEVFRLTTFETARLLGREVIDLHRDERFKDLECDLDITVRASSASLSVLLDLIVLVALTQSATSRHH